MARVARIVAPGLPHHVTQRGNNRCQVFFSDNDRRFYLLALMKYQRKCGVAVWGYCLMDNHVHVIAVPERAESLARCFAGTNLVYTQYINRGQRRSGRLWQNRFFSCPVDKDDYLWQVLRYVETNPVRAGLAQHPWDYAWSSARAHVMGDTDPVVCEPDWVRDELRRIGYRRYLGQEAPAGMRDIRRKTATGRPLGSKEFVDELELRLGRRLAPDRPGRPRRGGV